MAENTDFEHSLKLCYQIINAFDPFIGLQTRSVVDICHKMAESDHFDECQRRAFIAGAWLHDIGLIGFDRGVLHLLRNNPEDLTASELDIYRRHPIDGERLGAIVENVTGVGEIIRGHHERFDGQGYPDGIAGQTIPWAARCLAVAVYFVECGLPKAEALDAILALSGTGFDPDAVRLFFKMTQAADLPHRIREVMVDELVPGMRLAKGIYNRNGMLLVPADSPLNEATIEKINKYNLLTSVTERLLIYS